MNPLLVSVGNLDWTETGRNNLNNISETFGCDLLMLQPNRKLTKKMLVKAFERVGSPSWYLDYLIYAYPYRMAIKMGIKLLVYGEDVNYTYGGKDDEEKGYDKESGKLLVEVSPKYYRPAEVETLLGDYSKAKKQLGWKPSITFHKIVQIMAKADMKYVQKQKLLIG